MKRKWILLSALVCFVALMLCGCGETPLEKAAANLNKAADDHNYKVIYIKDSDTLEIDLENDDDRDFVFATLNKEIKDQDIGNLYFKIGENGYASLCEEEIGKLQCKSLQILGMNENFQKSGAGLWDPMLDKAGLIYMDTLPRNYGRNREKLHSLKRVWVGDSNLEGLSDYPEMEELGICARMMPSDRLADQTGAEVDAPTEEALAKAMEKQENVEFPGTYNNRIEMETVTKAPGLKHILIAPSDYSYVLDETNSAYLFLLQNYREDLLVNPPQTKLDVDPLKGGSDEDCVKIIDIDLPQLSDMARWGIVQGFLRQDVKPCYKKGNRMKEKDKMPVIKGRALVFMVDKDAKPWKSKKKFYDFGKVLGAEELGENFPLPQMKGDYRSFVYVYPTYHYVGSYDKGTKGYTQTWHCWVVDLKKGLSYKPVEIASKRPPNKFTFYGAPPEKKSGEVSQKKIYKYLKKIKRK